MSYVIINGNNVSMSPGMTVDVSIPRSDSYDVRVSSFWMVKSKKVSLENGSKIVINHTVPDWYYLLGLSCIAFLCTMTYLTNMNSFIVISALVLYMLPMFIVTFFMPNKYYNILVE